MEILGKRKGEQMAMLVHHSRNSVQKQWEETLVLALSGMARILRAHLPVLVDMPGFSQVISSASLRCQYCLVPCRHPYNTKGLGCSSEGPQMKYSCSDWFSVLLPSLHSCDCIHK